MAAGYLFKTQSVDSLTSYFDEMEKEMRSKGVEYILGVDHDEWLKYFKAKFIHDQIVLYVDQIKEEYLGRIARVRNREREKAKYVFKISVPFTGDGWHLHLIPRQCMLEDHYVLILETKREGVIEYEISLEKEDAKQFQRLKKKFLIYLRANTRYLNVDIDRINKLLEPRFRKVISDVKEQHEKESTFLKELGIGVNKETEVVFQIPKIERITPKEPEKVKDKITGKISEIPVISLEFYNDVCQIINKTYRAVEKKPSIYKNRDEEELRDYVLPVLETRYVESTATGETFNKEGKTDILIRNSDGDNLFVAECKYWHGAKLSQEAISQLFDKYLTWRDSKVALIYFVQEKGFSKIVEKVNESIQEHEYFVSFNKQVDESTYEYTMRLKDDPGKLVTLTAMCFSFPTIE